MNRESQIKELAEAWQALGDGRYVSTEVYGQVDESDVTTSFIHGDLQADFHTRGTDTDDATPCLSILRSVRGEDWDIHVHTDSHGVKRWEPHPLNLNEQNKRLLDRTMIVSEISRIHATTLAIQEKQ